jgi:hypothetical protein
MKHKKVFTLIILLMFTQLNLFAQPPTIIPKIRLVFEPGFSNSFKSGSNWQSVNKQSVKDILVHLVHLFCN